MSLYQNLEPSLGKPPNCINEKREKIFRLRFIELQCKGLEMTAKGDWGMASMYYGDCSDMMHILYLLKQGDLERARGYWANLDTAARDKYPSFVLELFGFSLRYSSPGETLKETE